MPMIGRNLETAPPYICLEHIDVYAGEKHLLQDVSWTIRRGENWAIIGGNGAGKSTLTKVLRGEMWVSPHSKGCVRYNFDGKGLTSSVAGVRKNIAVISPEQQESYHRLHLDMDAESAILSGFSDNFWFQGKPTETERDSADNVIEILQIGDLVHKNTLALSQGQMRKILLARALVTAPQCLILDEFCNGVDSASRNQLLGLIEHIAGLGVQIVMTTHRATEIIPSITHVLKLENGRISKTGCRADMLEHFGTVAAVEEQKDQRGNLLPKPKTHGAAAESPDFLLQIRGANVGQDGKMLLQDIDWEMLPQQNWAVLGRNGAGKSTFLKLVMGEIYPAFGGYVTRFGGNKNLSLWDLRQLMGHVSAEMQAQFDLQLTGLETVLSGYFGSVGLFQNPTHNQLQASEHLITQFGLQEYANRKLSTLSYGQVRKFLIARALVVQPKILILDEPCNGLDAPARQEFLTLLDQFVRESHTRLIMVTHHLDELIPVLSYVVVLEAGRMVESGPREYVFGTRAFQNLFAHKDENLNDTAFIK